MGKKLLFRRSRWRQVRRAFRLDFRVFLILVLGLILGGAAWQFGIDGDQTPATSPRARAGPRIPDPIPPGRLSVGPAQVEWAVRRAMRIGKPIRCGGGNQPVVALTFDDGPGPRTRRILRALADHGASATFFLVGERLAFPDVPTIAAMGPSHAIGNHTWSHVSMRGIGKKRRRQEIMRARRALEEAADAPVTLFRPPFGHRDRRLDALLSRLGIVQVLWNETVGDNRSTNVERILFQIRREVRPGAIILLHEKPPTVQAVPQILEILDERGLAPVTVPELLALDPPSRAQLQTGSCPAGSGTIRPEAAGGRP